MDRLRRIPVVFWRSLAGQEPAPDWLNDLTKEEKKVVGRDISKAQYGWPLGLPLCRSLGDGLWEMRSSLPTRREARILFVFHDGMLVALHAFFKKTRATPLAELELARRRRREMEL